MQVMAADADYRPPVRQGSLSDVAPGTLVAIIDGELPPDALLPDSEIRTALDRGIILYGAASVGAYHASTFTNQGMRGFGWVYQQYRLGTLSSFDEIAVLYDPFSLEALSIPLVNVRFWLQELVAASNITPEELQHALAQLRLLPLCDRDVLGIKRCLTQTLGFEMRKTLDAISKFPDIKATDARGALIRLIAERPAK